MFHLTCSSSPGGVSDWHRGVCRLSSVPLLRSSGQVSRSRQEDGGGGICFLHHLHKEQRSVGVITETFICWRDYILLLDSCSISSPGNEDIGHISTNPNKLTKAEIIFYWQIILLVLHLGLAGTSLLLQRVHKEVGGNLLHQSTHHPLLLAEPGGVALVVLHGVTHPGGPRGLLPHYDGLQVPGVPSGAVLLSSLLRLGQHTEISHHLNPRSHLLQRSPPLDL